ncbi:hypothetical protein G3I01_11535 [Gramella sp. MT6]|uniref:hypothetical protein n=1 Tax=Gramella sp. MT6 TaxID=2705471 RepID=UPI001C5F9D25|nr:hypothetical protein [Gramella sp. MT6]QYA26120.1 hypothetical protein G3I01_11535 [Gramella sp. MT6]
MSRVFKNLRALSIKKDKLRKYVAYALGEILLIIIGILIALNLNEKSIERDKTANFNTAISQIYTNLYCEYSWYEYTLEGLMKQRNIVALEMNDDLQVTDKEIPYLLVYLNSSFLFYETNSPSIIAKAQENIIDPKQSILVNQTTSYYSIWTEWDNNLKKERTKFLNELFSKYNFPYYPRLELYNDDFILNTQFNDKITIQEIQIGKQIRADEEYKFILKSILNQTDNLIFMIGYRVNETKALMEYFNDYNSDINLNFSNIGILGTALPDGWEKSTPMHLIDVNKQIWQIKIQLKDGVLKFRNGNSWNQNWGATDSYNGKALFFGKDIPVTEGFYQIDLNIVDKIYSIKAINEVENGQDE